MGLVVWMRVKVEGAGVSVFKSKSGGVSGGGR